MKKILLVIIFVFNIGIYINAQSFSISDINNNIWVAKDGLSFYSEVADLHLSISSSNATMTFVTKDTGETLKSFNYSIYLSSDKVTVFDKSKIGNNTGKYLNMHREYKFERKQLEELYSAKIISINDSILVLQFTSEKAPVTFYKKL